MSTGGAGEADAHGFRGPFDMGEVDLPPGLIAWIGTQQPFFVFVRIAGCCFGYCFVFLFFTGNAKTDLHSGEVVEG